MNPTNPQNLLAGQNDYRRGDGACGADFSLDGGQHWGNTLLPVGFVVPGVDNPSARHYWTSSGDPSVAFDSEGAAYFGCMAFDRAFPTNDDGCQNNAAGFCASGLFVFRSVDGGAAWTTPAGLTAAGGTGQVVATPTFPSSTGQFNLEDKPYMAIDARTSSPFRDRIYVSWTHYAPCSASPSCETANIYLAYSNDHGTTFSTPQNISGHSPALCPIALNPKTPNACDNNDYSQPFVAPNGDVYVAFRNFNNSVTAPNNFNDIVVVKSTDGGAHFGSPVLVSRFYDLPDCVSYTGDDAFRACVPTSPLSDVSVFRMADYPSAVADPSNPAKLYVTFGSYINPHSNPSKPRGQGFCAPNGFSATTGLNLYTGVGDVNGCNNDILLSVSTDGGRTWSAARTGVRNAEVVSDESSTRLTDQFTQWAAISGSGRLTVAYYDRKYGNDEASGALDVTMAASTAGGFAHKRVTDIPTPPPTEFPDMTNGYSVFIGDYNGLAVSGSTAYPMWTDSRNQQFFQCPSLPAPLGLCRVTNGNVPGFDEDVFSTFGLALPRGGP